MSQSLYSVLNVVVHCFHKNYSEDATNNVVLFYSHVDNLILSLAVSLLFLM